MCRTRGLVTRCGGVQSPLALRSGKPNLCAHAVGDVDGVYGGSIGAYFTLIAYDDLAVTPYP